MTETTRENYAAPRKRKSVNIVAMGSSRETWFAGMMCDERPPIFRDSEVWFVNYMAAISYCDRLIALDPVHQVFDPVHTGKKYDVVKEMLDRTAARGVPVYTSEPHPDYPNHIMYPFHKVHEQLRSTYFNTTVAYALALAIVDGYEQIGLFGCDFTYPDVHVAESGRACVEYWLSHASARGIQVAVASTSTLMDMRNSVKWRGPFGTDEQESPTQQCYGFWENHLLPPENGGKLMHPQQIIAKTKAWWANRDENGKLKDTANGEANIVHLSRTGS